MRQNLFNVPTICGSKRKENMTDSKNSKGGDIMYAALVSPGMKLLEPCIQQHCYDGFVPKGGGHCINDGNNPALRNTCSTGYIPGVLP